MRKKQHSIVWVSLAVVLAIASCKTKDNKAEVHRDTTITQESSFNNLFLDSARIEHFLSSNPSLKNYERQFIDFYKSRNYEFAWFGTAGLIEQTGNLINLLNTSIAENKDSSLYDAKLYHLYDDYKTKTFDKKKITEQDLDAELYFTGQFFKYTSKQFKGADLDATQLGWFIPRKKINLSSLLDSTLKNNNAQEYLSSLLNPNYKKLNEYLQKYLAIKKDNPEWDSLRMPVSKLKLGDDNPFVSQIKQRLALLGDLDENDETGIFDETTEEAVKSYQTRMGLGSDGVVGPAFVRSINTPLDTLIRKILVNIERARWLPASIPDTYIWVNIPEFKLHTYQDNEQLFDMRVIVGSAAHNTVIFSGNLRYVVFAPYWNVPPSIIKNEIIPGIARDPNYLASHNMQIFARNKKGEPVDVRQLPGPDNSLGSVKFLFPNNYNIYLHDTPNHDLFTSSNRGMSHGCIRLSDPMRMAQFLLRNDSTTYSTEVIDSLMHNNTKETWVSFKPTVPVYLVYFTAWVDDNGKLNIRKDIYGHDNKVAAKLFN
ncbi:MAG: L,D-transpeptidase family protein [Chitinophagaceae bacterium]